MYGTYEATSKAEEAGVVIGSLGEAISKVILATKGKSQEELKGTGGSGSPQYPRDEIPSWVIYAAIGFIIYKLIKK
jgi:hypothetical protein